MKTTFCITSRGRLWQLKHTLRPNLDTHRSDDRVDFVLVDYNSSDGLAEWIEQHFLDEVRSGQLTFVREHAASGFHMSKAKNLAHRFARGDMLCNLDADNWVDGLVDACGALEDDAIIHGIGQEVQMGTPGRICVPRAWFYALGGYDESFHPMGYQDIDLLNRARAAGYEIKRLNQPCRPPIPNHPLDLTDPVLKDRRDMREATGVDLTWSEMQQANACRSRENVRAGSLVVNRAGWGGGLLSINFAAPTIVTPIIPVTESPTS